MSIEKLGKIGISVGIVVGVLIIFMIGASIPDTIERYNPNYNTPRFQQDSEIENVDAEFLMEKFFITEEHSIFVERFPKHIEDLNINENNGHLRLIAFNTDTNNILELQLSWNSNNPRIDKTAYCQVGNSLYDDGRIRASGSAVANYLMKTDCLD